jgi:hypothetical protein
MKTATITWGHVYGTTNSSWINADYHGRHVCSTTCHQSELSDRTEALKENLRNQGFTHYKTAAAGKPITL